MNIEGREKIVSLRGRILRYSSSLALLIVFTFACLAGLGRTSGLQQRLQQTMYRAVSGQRGAAVAIDVVSGRVLASVNLNGAAKRLVRPGSTVKPFTLLALLTSGAVAPKTLVACHRKLEISGHKLDCGHPTAVGPLDAVSALAYSCNDYFTSMAVRLRPGDLREAFLRAGLGSASGLNKHEAVGHVELCTTREQLQLQAIGEENIRTTPLAVLNAFRQLALRRRMGNNDAIEQVVYRGLEAATEYGMARLAQPPGRVKVAGKTGTSVADEGRWTHGWFVGFAPAERPEIALVVFLEHGTGPSNAAPIAREIFSAYAAQVRP